MAVYRAERHVSPLGNVGPARAEDAFFGVESDRGVHDPSASLGIRGGPTRHPVGPWCHS